MYEVKIAGEEVGYVHNKQALEESIEENIENYSGKNIESVELKEDPEYELKFVEKTKEIDESTIIIALQKELEITYKYYEISLNGETIENVDSIETAEQIVNDIKERTKDKTILTINEKTTTNTEEANIQTLETAKENIMKKLNIEKEITTINGIKIATLPVTGNISSRYGDVSSIRSSTHTGLDIVAPIGTQIKVVADGIVTCASYNGAYGNLVKVDHGNGLETWYAHTSQMLASVGQEVKAGDIIALVGSTGNSTGAHLHLEIRINGQHVNPQNYLYK